MDFSELIKARYSLRKFSPEPVDEAALAAVLEAGRCAPTAKNYQPQRGFVLRSAEAREKADACMDCHFHPPVLLAVAYDPAVSWKRERDGTDYGPVDASLAVSQMLLQAAALGLGSCCIGLFDPEKLKAAFSELAGLEPVLLLALGHPAEGAHPARLHNERKPLEEFVTTL